MLEMFKVVRPWILTYILFLCTHPQFLLPLNLKQKLFWMEQKERLWTQLAGCLITQTILCPVYKNCPHVKNPRNVNNEGKHANKSSHLKPTAYHQ